MFLKNNMENEITTTLLDTPISYTSEEETVPDVAPGTDDSLEYQTMVLQELKEIKEIESRNGSILEIIAVALILFIVFRAAFSFLNIFKM